MVTPGGAGPSLKPLHSLPNFSLIFTFREKGIPILRFFLGLMIFTFGGAPRLFLCAGPRSLVMCFQVLPLFMLWDSSHSDGIALAQNFQCVSCKINFFDLFFSKNAFCSPRAATPFRRRS